MKKTFLAFAALILGLSLFGGSAHAEDCYSTGTRVGTIQKLSQKGYANKSYEGELVQAGIKTKNDTISNVWRFSILDPKVGAAVDQAVASGLPVALHYCQLGFRNPLKTDTSYIITSVSTPSAQADSAKR